MRIRLVICAATLALVAGACGSDDTTTVTEPAVSEAAETAAPDAPAEAADSAGDSTVDSAVADDGAAASPAPAGPGDVPDLQMINMHTGTTVSLQSVVDGQTPLLFWFWAPH